MDVSTAVVWPPHSCCSVETCLLKIAGPSRLTHKFQGSYARPESRLQVGVLSSGVPQSDPRPLWVRKCQLDFAVS